MTMCCTAEAPTRHQRVARTAPWVWIACGLLLGCSSSDALAQTRTPQRDTVPPVRTLPALIAQASRGECTSRDEPGARAVWERLRDRYSRSADSLSVWTTRLVNSAGWIDDAGLHRFESAESNRPDGTTSGWNTQEVRRDTSRRVLQFSVAPRVGPGSRGMSGSYRQQLTRDIAANGYARILPGTNADLTQVFAAWAYPPLEAELATHFLSDEFGRRNAFSPVTSGPAQGIAFCTRSPYRSKPYISGILTLRADTTLERAYWSFHTAAPDEHAGGEAEFAPYDAAGGLPVLLPVRGTFWRRDGIARFYQRQQTFAGWLSGPRAALPPGLVDEPQREDFKPIVIFRTVIDSVRTH